MFKRIETARGPVLFYDPRAGYVLPVRGEATYRYETMRFEAPDNVAVIGFQFTLTGDRTEKSFWNGCAASSPKLHSRTAMFPIWAWREQKRRAAREEEAEQGMV